MGFAFRSTYPTRCWGLRLMAITTRPVAEHDLKLICEHRERMFAESGRTRESLRPMTAAFEQWLLPRLEDGSYFGWMLEDAGVVIAGLGMMVIASSEPCGRPPPRVHPQRLRGARAPPQGAGQAVDGAGRGEGTRTRRLLRDPSFDAAGPSALRRSRMGSDERDGDPVGIVERPH